jgi:putative ABC transport system permease protein
MPGLQSVSLDLRSALFAVASSLLAAVLAGVVPALGVMRTRLASWLADRSGGSGPGAQRAQQSLAIGQVGLAVALLVTAALLVESFRQLRSVDPGFRPAQVTTAKLTLAPARYPDNPAKIRFVDRIVAELQQSPGIEAAGLIDAVPIADNRQGTSFVRTDGPAADPTASQNSNVAWVSEGYFEALGVPLLAGRTFTAEDATGRDRVVIINRLLARQVFGSDDPIGRLVRVGASTQAPFQVVGVVGDERHLGVAADPTAAFFIPYRQVPSVRDLSIIVRSRGAADGAANAIRAAVRRIDPEIALFHVKTMEQVMDAAMATPRSMAWLLSTFAVAALLLAAIGVFGVMSHAVSQRTREIGVRMAIGATPSQMLASILREGLTQVALGLLAGAILSLLTARLLTGLLFGVAAMSITPYLIVISVLAAVSLVACLIPARRAMRVDPALALRAD